LKTLIVLLLCLLYAILNVAGAGIIKNELMNFQKEGHQLSMPVDYAYFLFRLKVILGFVVILFSALTMFKALSLQNFSFVAPLATGINFLLTIVVGVIFFKDKISLPQYLGLMFIISGIMLVSLSAKTH